VRDGQVILFRHHGKFLLGRYAQGPAGKLQVTVEPDRVVRINPQQVVLEMEVVVSAQEFPAWKEQCEALLLGMDLAAVWDVLEGERQKVALGELAGLYWSEPPSALRRAALLVHLHTQSTYFTARDGAFEPRPREELKALVRQRRQEEEAAQAEAAFLRWLSGAEATPAWTPRQEELLDGLRQYAALGDVHPAADKVRKLLRQVQPAASDWRRLAFTLLVQRGVFQEDEPLELYRRGVPLNFPPEVLRASQEVSLQESLGEPGRRDLTSLELVTVDEATTTDMDDGLSLQKTDDGYLLGIHIADACALVPPGGPLDAEAARRVMTLYLPERIIPMLPSRISQELGSLAPDGPRLALSILIHVGADLVLGAWEVTPAVVRSRARLTYEEVDAALRQAQDKAPAGEAAPPLQLLQPLVAIAQRVKEGRQAAGAVELSRPELRVSVDAQAHITVAVTPAPTPARKLVAEFMVLANRLLAEFCRDRGVPAIYRSQEPLDLTDLEGTLNPAVWSYQVSRRLRPSDLGLEPRPHALLGVPAYFQATSPLRRYLDLVLQRQIMHAVVKGRPLYSTEALAQVLYQVGDQARELGRLEEQRKRYWLLKHLSARAEETFQGVVLDLRDHEATVELLEYPLRLTLYLAQPAGLGETVTMQLREVDLWRLRARFNQAGGSPSPASSS
jgi:exoribonuclease-2